MTQTMTKPPPLSTDQQWIMSYLHTHLENWGDVRNDALRTLRKVKTQRDFIDWKDYFLPDRRYKQVLQALTSYKEERKRNKPKGRQQAHSKIISIPVEEQVARLLQQRARDAHCSISELLRRKLA